MTSFSKNDKRYEEIFLICSSTSNFFEIRRLGAAESFLSVLNGLHPSIHFTMELSNNVSIPFIGTLITKNGNKLETQVYRKPTNTGLLLHFQSHTDLRYKKCLIKTMVHRAKELSSTHQAFVDECRHLKSMFHRLGSLFFGELYYRQM